MYFLNLSGNVDNFRDILDRYRPRKKPGKTQYFISQCEAPEKQRHVRKDAYSGKLSYEEQTGSPNIDHLLHTGAEADQNDKCTSPETVLPDDPSKKTHHSKELHAKEAFLKGVKKAREMLRQNEFEGLLTNVDSAPSDIQLESLIERRVATKEALSPETMARIDLKSCQNVRAAAKLQRSSIVEMDGLRGADLVEYVQIGSRESNFTLPIWGLAPYAEELFATPTSTVRFNVLVNVVSALAAASLAKWHHRRLSASDIVIHVSSIAKTFSPHSHDESKAPAPPIAKVLHFRCPITSGCFDQCSRCKQTSDYIIHALSSGRTQDVFRNYLPHSELFLNGDENVADGNYADAKAFSSFVLWLYSGKTLKNTVDQNQIEDAILRVPWPLRWIVAEAGKTSIIRVSSFLLGLRERRINPHGLDRSILNFNNFDLQTDIKIGSSGHVNRAPNTNCYVESDNQFMVTVHYDHVVKCALSGALSDEPEAAIHLGKLWETKAIELIQEDKKEHKPFASRNHQAENALLKAYQCFWAASCFGEPLGLLKMARVHAFCIEMRVQLMPDVEIGIEPMLSLVLDAAVGENEDALTALKNVVHVGTRLPSLLFPNDTNPFLPILKSSGRASSVKDHTSEIGSVAENWCVDRYQISTEMKEDEIMNAAVAIGKCWRGGRAGLSQNETIAGKWLLFAASEGFPAGLLEFGLLLRQTASSAKDLFDAYGYVKMASQSRPSQTGYVATYWIARWLHDGLMWYSKFGVGDDITENQEDPDVYDKDRGVGGSMDYKSNIVVVKKDYTLAFEYVRVAASSKYPDAMALLSRFFRLGLGPVEKNDQIADMWNKDARNAKSTAAFCAHALVLVNEAQNLFRLTLENDTGKLFLNNDQTMSNQPNTSVVNKGTNFNSSSEIKGKAEASSSTSKRPFMGGIMFFHRRNSRAQKENQGQTRSTQPKKQAVNSSVVSENELERRRKQAKVECLFEEAMSMLKRPSIEFAHTKPEQALDPLPLLLAGIVADNHALSWGKCASVVQRNEESLSSFVRKKKIEAYEYLNSAAAADKNERWKRLRVNHLQRDRRIIADAKTKLELFKANQKRVGMF